MKKYLLILFLTLPSLLIINCHKNIGYGVILWNISKNNNINNNTIINISRESIINKSYIGKTIKKPSNKIELSKNLFYFSKSLSEVKKFSRDYKKFTNIYAICSYQYGLYIRTKPNTFSSTIYKMRPNQIVKVLTIINKEVKIQQFTGKWIKVITDDGTTGYIFDYYLKIYEQKTSNSPIKIIKYPESKKEIDPKTRINMIVNRLWYEQSFVNRLIPEKGLPDDRFFNDKNGFIIDTKKKKVFYKNEKIAVEENYQKINYLSSHLFELKGSSFKLKFNDKLLTINFIYNGKEIIKKLRYVPKNKLNRIKQAIIQYKRDKITSLITNIKQNCLLNLFSENHLIGTLNITKVGNFQWENLTFLQQKNIIDYSNKTHNGQISFIYQLDESLKSKYDGIISFTFYNSQITISFFYKINSRNHNEINFIYIPSKNIDNKTRIIKDDDYIPKYTITLNHSTDCSF